MTPSYERFRMTMPPNIPKEQMTAWQRWEMADFDTNKPKSNAATTVQGVSLPTVEELEQLREQAHQEGFATGRAEGIEAGRKAGHVLGYDQGLRDGQEAAQTANAASLDRLNQLLIRFDQELTHADKTIANDVLQLACDLAGAMLKTALPIRPELLLPLISQAITTLPAMQGKGRLHLHPLDAMMVRSHLHEDLTHWQVVEDANVTPGGCHIDTHQGTIDASIETRWGRLMAQLEQDPSWLQTSDHEHNAS